MVKASTPGELAGKWEMIKDTAGNEKKGLCLTIYPMGPALVSARVAASLATHPCATRVSSPLCAPSHSLPTGAVRIPPAVRRLRHCGQRIYGQMLLPVRLRAVLPLLRRHVHEVQLRYLRSVHDHAARRRHHRRHDAGHLPEERSPRAPRGSSLLGGDGPLKEPSPLMACARE